MLFLKRKKLLNIFKYETLKNKVISKSDPCSLQLAADSNNMYSLFCTIDKHKKAINSEVNPENGTPIKTPKPLVP